MNFTYILRCRDGSLIQDGQTIWRKGLTVIMLEKGQNIQKPGFLWNWHTLRLFRQRKKPCRGNGKLRNDKKKKKIALIEENR